MAQVGDYDQTSTDTSLDEEEGGKHGLLWKLKDKTMTTGKKLKSKLKPGSNSSDTTGETTTEEESEEEPTPTQNASTKDESPFSTGPTSGTPLGAALSSGQTGYGQDGQTGYGVDTKASDKAFPADPSVYKTTDSSSIQEAVPTNYSYYNKDVGRDELPSDKSTDVPAVVGGRSVGLTSAIENLSIGSESPFAKRDEPTQTSQESLLSTPVDQDQGVHDDEKSVGLGTVAVGAGAGAAGLSAFDKSPSNDKSFSEMRSSSDPAASRFGTQSEGEGITGAASDKASEVGKTWTQWAAEKVGYAKDTAVAKAPTTNDGKPVHQAAYDSAVGAKDSAVDSAYGVRDAAATHTNPNQIPSDPNQQSYVQKATGAVYGAKDSLFSSTQPGEHDKALSQKVSETVGNLPATLKSYLPIVGNKASTTDAASGSPASSTTEEAAGAPPQSPSIVGRITGLFGGAKKPAHEEAPMDTTTPTTTDSGVTPISTS